MFFDLIADCFDEVAGAKRLGQIGIRAHCCSFGSVFFLAYSRNDDDGNVSDFGIISNH